MVKVALMPEGVEHATREMARKQPPGVKVPLMPEGVGSELRAGTATRPYGPIFRLSHRPRDGNAAARADRALKDPANFRPPLRG
jgi:hypothetical protein